MFDFNDPMFLAGLQVMNGANPGAALQDVITQQAVNNVRAQQVKQAEFEMEQAKKMRNIPKEAFATLDPQKILQTVGPINPELAYKLATTAVQNRNAMNRQRMLDAYRNSQGNHGGSVDMLTHMAEDFGDMVKVEQLKVQKAKADQENEERRQKERAELANFESAQQAALSAAQDIDDLLNHKGFKSAVGSKALELDFGLGVKEKPFEGTASADFISSLEGVQSKAFLDARQLLKGGGAITDFESKKAEQAFSNMNTATSESQFIKAAKDAKDAIYNGVNKLRSARGMDALSPNGTQSKNNIVMVHPEYGNVSEQDILDTMKANDMTREQVIKRLSY